VHVFPAEASVHERLVALGFEGSVLKRRDSRYRPGQRSSAWQKVKTRARTRAKLEIVHVDRHDGRVHRAAHDTGRLTWLVVWGGKPGAELTADPVAAVGREADLIYTHAPSPARYAKRA
jgi:hypothetical protein